jgi:hypothetical protein
LEDEIEAGKDNASEPLAGWIGNQSVIFHFPVQTDRIFGKSNMPHQFAAAART